MQSVHFSKWDYAGISHHAFCAALFFNQMHHSQLFANLSHSKTEKTVLGIPVAAPQLFVLYCTAQDMGSTHTSICYHTASTEIGPGEGVNYSTPGFLPPS